MRHRLLFRAAWLAMLLPAAASAQQADRTTPVVALRDNTPAVHAFRGARIVVAPGRVLENATLVIRDGLIEAVGTNASVPADARVWDATGLTLYPGFIDGHADLAITGAPPEGETDPGPVHWNPQVRPYFSAAGDFRGDTARRQLLRSQGFTTAHAVPGLGIFRGSTAVLSLGDDPISQRVIRRSVAQSLKLDGDGQLGGGYPNSPMGAIALVRQTLLDADWYIRAWNVYRDEPTGLTPPETNIALASLEPVVQSEVPLLIETTSEAEIFRAHAIADEFPVDLWLRGNGSEYRVIDVLQEQPTPLILPLDFPGEPDVETPEDALDVGLDELREWYLAPENPARLARAGIEFALTADELNGEDEFLDNLREAIDRGFPRDVALAALTTTPAEMFGIAATHGTLEAGKHANIVVVDGDVFSEDGVIRDVWVEGKRYEINPAPVVDPRGDWVIRSDDPRLNGRLQLGGSIARPRGSITLNGNQATLASASIATQSGHVTLTFPASAVGMTGVVQLSASVTGEEAFGWSQLPDGVGPQFRAERTARFTATDVPTGSGPGPNAGDDEDARQQIVLPLISPPMAFGRERIPEQPENVLVRNATIWTQGPQGTLENADLLVTAGKIAQVGQNLDAPAGAVVVDATGKHVTPGLIDAHSHSGTDGTNESGFAIVPEVRMGDVVNHNTSNVYRQLAGGLTMAHVMHGSANPIGGQNVFLKMRWGARPDEMKLDNAPRTVKFALGENPKRRQGRYPDTRMGTQEIIRDHFKAARDYERRWKEWEETHEGLPPRRDLRMEALAGILNGEIGIQSHGYRQDEFLALIRLAEEFGFEVQALQHALEAYKIAPELARAGVAAVVWSDWSAFKVEAYDGTPYNARILLEAGVVTSLHSDDGQITTRMNWEAGKLLRTGLTEEQALSLVTSGTAKVFGLEDRVGSLQPGLDADFVIWSGHPLSQFTHAEQTWVDGRKYFDIDEDKRLREQAERERAMLIQLILDEN